MNGLILNYVTTLAKHYINVNLVVSDIVKCLCKINRIIRRTFLFIVNTLHAIHRSS